MRAEVIDQSAAKDIDTTADQPGTGPWRPSSKSGDPVAHQFNGPKPRRIGQRPYCNDTHRGVRGGQAAIKVQQVDIEPRISVKKQEPVVESIAGLP